MFRTTKAAPLKNVFKKSVGFTPSSKGNDCIKPEDCLVGGLFTATFNPSEQPDLTTVSGFSDWWAEQEDRLTSIPGATVRLYCEFSKKGRWHFHGWIKVSDPFDFYIRGLPRLEDWYHYEVDTFDIHDGHITWHTYCLKAQRIVQPFLLRELIPFDRMDAIEASGDFICINNLWYQQQ